MCIRDRIKTVQAMTELLESYENEEYYRQSRRRNDRPEIRSNQYPSNSNNQNGNNYPVSYTHLDVYKRQPLTPEGIITTAGTRNHWKNNIYLKQILRGAFVLSLIHI